MISSTHAWLIDLANQVGFSDTGQSSRAFQSMTGTAPQCFRRRLRNQQGDGFTRLTAEAWHLAFPRFIPLANPKNLGIRCKRVVSDEQRVAAVERLARHRTALQNSPRAV
jgi:hypothetical protein